MSRPEPILKRIKLSCRRGHVEQLVLDAKAPEPELMCGECLSDFAEFAPMTLRGRPNANVTRIFGVSP